MELLWCCRDQEKIDVVNKLPSLLQTHCCRIVGMLRAHFTTSPHASMSCATVASGLLLDTKITVPACLSVCIDPLTLPDSTLSPLAFAWP
jgi:hypothetical protein